MAASDHIKQRILLMRQKWYHGTITEFESERRVKINGDFLVRECFRATGNLFMLTIKWNEKILHLPIRSQLAASQSCWLYTFGEEYCLSSVVSLVMFHWKNSCPLLKDSKVFPKFPVETAPSYSGKKSPILLATKVITQSTSTSATLCVRTRKYPPARANRPLTELNSIYTELEQCNVDTKQPPPEKQTEQVPLSKGSQINRKKIRYVVMASNIDPQGTGLRVNIPASPVTVPNRCSKEALLTLASRFAVPAQAGLSRYDLSSHDLLPPEIGPVKQALSQEAWHRVCQLCANRQISPLLVADHLTAGLVDVLTYPNEDTAAKDTAVPGGLNGMCTLLHPSAVGYRADLVCRDRFLRLFIVASILMPEEITCAAGCLMFWLDVAQTLYAILRDMHSLQTVLTAIFSPQLMCYSKCWTLVNNLTEQEPRVFTVDDLYAVHMTKVLVEQDQTEEASLTQTKEILAGYLEQMQTFLADLRPLIVSMVRSTQGSTVAAKAPTETEGDDNNGQLEGTALLQDALMVLTSAESKPMWINELRPCLQERQPLVFSLLTTPAMLALLLGPVKMQYGPVLDGLVDKLETTLQKIAEKREAEH